MQWLGRRQSTNVDDRRGITGGHIAAGGGILGIIGGVLAVTKGITFFGSKPRFFKK